MPAAPASLPVKLAIALAAFAVVTGIAELIGTKNLGTSMTFGQISFVIVAAALMLAPARTPAGSADEQSP